MTGRQPASSSQPTLRADRGESPRSAALAPSPDNTPGVVLPETIQNERFYTHQLTVLSVSSGMVGVCLTAIGLIGIRTSLSGVESFVDDMLAVGSVLFMMTALFSFFAMRTRLSRAWCGIERTIDVGFCLGLVLVVVATALLTWEMF
jgi:hypothetical protein